MERFLSRGAGKQQVPSHGPAIPLPQRGSDTARGEPGAMNKDLKCYYLHLQSEAEPGCRFTAPVNRKFMFTSFQEKTPAFLSYVVAQWGHCLTWEFSDWYARQE